MLQLAATFGTLADEREVGARLGRRRLDLHGGGRLLLVGEGARRVGLALESAAREHDALGDGLLRRGQQALVEPDRVRARHLVQGARHLARIETAAQHLRGEQAHAARNRPRGEDFKDLTTVVIDRYVEVRAVEGNLPRRPAQLARALDAQVPRDLLGERGHGGRDGFRLRAARRPGLVNRRFGGGRFGDD